jgi:hypothetical protein
MNATKPTPLPLIFLAWTAVLIPLMWGVIRTLENVLKLFN